MKNTSEHLASKSRKALQHLRDLVHDSDCSMLEIESRAGFHRGYLSQLLAGSLDLKVWQLLAILQVIDTPPARFFADLYPRQAIRRQATQKKSTARNPLRVNLDVVRIYDFGIDSLQALRQRLESCEEALADVARRRALEPPDPDSSSDP